MKLKRLKIKSLVSVGRKLILARNSNGRSNNQSGFALQLSRLLESSYNSSSDSDYIPSEESEYSSDFSDSSSYYTEDEIISDQEYDSIHNVNLEIEIIEDEALMQFPLNIFFEIMSRLPVRVLGQCRCVCKTWLTLIRHHHLFTIARPIQFCCVIVPLKCYKGQSLNNIVMCSVVDNILENLKIVKQRFGSSNFEFEIVGSCNGLLCLYEDIYCQIYIANPVIREYVKVPITVGSEKSDVVFGFCYDQVSDEYKVICLVFESDRILDLKGQVYGLRSGMWRSIGDISYPLRASSSRVFLNGALHWMTDEYVGVSTTELIIAFDVSKEYFLPIPPPSGFSFSPDIYRYNLGDLRSNLCLFYMSSDNVFEIWAMKKYGVKDSWTKDYIISRQELGRDSLYLHPIEILENDDLLLEHEDESLLCYNNKKMSCRELYSHILPPTFDAITHVESLVSLREFTVAATRY